MKALISGGTGLVGRYIVEALLDANYEIVVGGRTPPAGGLFSKPVEFRPLSLDPDRSPGDMFADVDAFIHAAFDHLPGRYRGGEGDDPARFRRSNVEGTINLFEAAKRADVRRVVFLSSRAVYDGVPPGTRLTETLDLQPASLYGEIKLLGERALAGLNAPDFVTSGLRLTGVYGELRPNKWDTLFADFLAGREIPVRAGSEVHGHDVGQAVRLMLESELKKIGGQAFNVSDLVADTCDLLETLHQNNPGSPALPLAADKSGVAEMDTSKIRRLGWIPGGWPLLKKTTAVLSLTQ
ncbi:NAD-dependent epimerase/dehydratase family protein [Hoeflea ulvae]|uniref:NAD(P)-dependent oxidoreductase n=1 Tax=Hoeflea ulvae TaxID=2983764 RepID=A0ABT3YKN1_9HYPH|nr:NAD(P)-dependent oxidoreductase [Hoeflea ulvae]MCY0096460.1 NAD(P)-dependent oxidoreductase [Hoeflea ulvae]